MLLRIVLVSFRNLCRRPLHTLLILQGVIWGTALGVLPSAIIHGTQRQTQREARSLGIDRVLLGQEQVEVERHFDWELVAALREEMGDVAQAACGMTVLGSSEATGFALIATDSHALAARGQSLAAGRFLSADDISNGASVCVLEHGLKQQIFGDREALGQRLTVRAGEELSLRVIGVLAPRAEGSQGMDSFGYQRDHVLTDLVSEVQRYLGVFEDDRQRILTSDRAAVVPYTLLPDRPPQWVEMRADPEDVLGLRDRLRERLIVDGYEPVVYINAVLPTLYGDVVETFVELNRVVFVLCVLVGTSIVCVIMVLSVVERRHEIAIRRVEGARRWHIGLQFVVETGTLCAVGSLVGVPLGLLLASVRCAIEPLGSIAWAFPAAEVATLTAVVTVIGLAGGLLPAWGALRVDPVQVLRDE